jgi:hypothetical protein
MNGWDLLNKYSTVDTATMHKREGYYKSLQLFVLDITPIQRRHVGVYDLQLTNYFGASMATGFQLSIKCSDCECATSGYPHSILKEGEDDCVCGDGYYYWGNYSNFTCIPCPPGANCTGNPRIEDIITKPKFYRVSNFTDEFYACGGAGRPNASACIGGNQSRQCDDSTEGLLCNQCKKNYYLQGEKCQECPSSPISFEDLSTALKVSLTLATIALVKLTSDHLRGVKLLEAVLSTASKTETAVADTAEMFDAAEMFVLTFKITISWTQCLAPLLFVFSIPWPEEFKQVLRFIADMFAIFDPQIVLPKLGFGGVTCTIDTGFSASILPHMCLLPYVIFVLGLSYCVARIRTLREMRKIKKAAADLKKAEAEVAKAVLSRTIETFLFVIFLVYPSVCTKIFRIFKCEDYSGFEDPKLGIGGVTKKYLAAELRHECSTDHTQHARNVKLGYFFMIVYVIGIPAFLFLILWWLGEESRKKPTTKARWGSLYRTYKPHAYYFEIIVSARISPQLSELPRLLCQEMLRKMVLTGGLVLLAPGSSLQIVLGIVVCALYVVVLANLRPYIDKNIQPKSEERQAEEREAEEQETTDKISIRIRCQRWYNSFANGNSMSQLTGGQLFATLLLGLWIKAAKPTELQDVSNITSNCYNDDTANAVLLVLFTVTAFGLIGDLIQIVANNTKYFLDLVCIVDKAKTKTEGKNGDEQQHNNRATNTTTELLVQDIDTPVGFLDSEVVARSALSNAVNPADVTALVQKTSAAVTNILDSTAGLATTTNRRGRGGKQRSSRSDAASKSRLRVVV